MHFSIDRKFSQRDDPRLHKEYHRVGIRKLPPVDMLFVHQPKCPKLCARRMRDICQFKSTETIILIHHPDEWGVVKRDGVELDWVPRWGQLDA